MYFYSGHACTALDVVADIEAQLRKIDLKMKRGQGIQLTLAFMATKVNELKTVLQDEKLAQEIASFSEHGHYTLKAYERPPMFEGDNADELFKRWKGFV